jgi:hypothetical protein
MRYLRIIVWILAIVSNWVSAPAEACSVQIHFSKSQIEAAHIALYEREEKLWDQNPAPFDLKHPLLGELLSNQGVYDNLLQNWESHPVRFEHQNSFLWRVLDGDMLYHEKHPFEPAISPSTGNVLPLEVSGQGNPGNPQGVQKPSGGSDIASVPEPSAGVLMLSAPIAGLLGAASRRIVGRLRLRS